MPSTIADFRSFASKGDGWNLHFRQPLETIRVDRLADVLPALREINTATRNGLWAAIAVSYEAAPAFEPAMRVHSPGQFPILWAALFESPTPRTERTHQPYSWSGWTPEVDEDAYTISISAIREHIREGETYQVNYTIPLTCPFTGDAMAYWEDLGRAQGAGFAAYLDLGSEKVLSLSPELFFQRNGCRVVTRPMKGTAGRGRWLEEDVIMRDTLAACPKNRAENVMIVDLLRNDLGRIAVPGSVVATSLFEVERYETVWQMTSTIEATLLQDIGLPELFTALFPCGSVTGAPKIRTMELINRFERAPRGVYCGAIGIVRPGGDCMFNVPIRTITVRPEERRALFHVGGGVTWDSSAKGEYDECLAKMRFLSQPYEGFQLLESLLLERGEYFLLDRHLRRLQESACFFDFKYDDIAVRRLLEAQRVAFPHSAHKVRLLHNRAGDALVEVAELPPSSGKSYRVGWAVTSVSSTDVFLHHKTTRRGVYTAAIASRPDCDDVLLVNERGDVTESCIANIVAQIAGQLVTPPRDCGLLAGVFRQELLEQGELRERRLTPADLIRAERVWLVNSVRKWVEIDLAHVS